MSTVLLTGASGFVGTWITRWILENTDHDLIVPIRGEDQGQATARLRRAWWDWPYLREQLASRIEIIPGDITKRDLGLSPQYLSRVKEADRMIHCAATVWFNRPREEMESTNILGTSNVIDLARKIHSNGGLERFSHVSTAYIAGKRMGDILEKDLDDALGFNNDYEWSKFRAEQMVREIREEFPVTIFRPGMIVGDTKKGMVKNFNTLYIPLRLYLSGKLRILPVRKGLRVNMVPVDYVADSIARMTFDTRAEGETLHLTPPTRSMPTALEFIETVREWGEENLHEKMTKPVFLRIPMIGGSRAMSTYRLLTPYLNERRSFVRDKADRLLGEYDIEWRPLLERMLEYATYYGFFHRSERTVHEQIVFRMGSQSRPVSYQDIEKGKPIPRDAIHLRSDIFRCASAIRSLGIGPGDKVAMVGLNSARFLVVDAGIGLTGAVSVPLYYTSPTSEIQELLEDSGAKMIFVGAPHLLEQVKDYAGEMDVISFEENQPPIGVKSWDDFLALGSEDSVSCFAGPDDIATLRYTSSTTGRPKGVEFTHSQLRWMAEAVVSLYSYRDRIKPLSYLSFLPMNHVVEGVLGNYSPYYVPAPLEISFLRDFHDISKALPMVRPRIFFSVPRFYEKVLEKFKESPHASKFAASKGIIRRIRKKMVRRALLHRTGLDRCEQLIVGSAPTSQEMLMEYRDLGIEVHDAYGLTEAPLIAINREGANKIGTVGQPMPETELRISDEGEILVKGPQVMVGYHGEAEKPFIDGWLRTGDQGSVDEEGYLRVKGRLKEIMVTSYGKNIQPLKVETMLKSVSGIREALVIADSRPFCTALLFVEKVPDEKLNAEIDDQVRSINTSLSHPEQIVRWSILPFDLSIDNGELTANLKMKRSVVEEKYKNVVNSLYSGEPVGSVHMGEAGGMR
jgi:long-chain acyl-CoA synthetase